MNRIKYMLILLICKIFKISDIKMCSKVNKLYRKSGMKIGKGCRIYSYILNGEGPLIKIGDNVTISYDVNLITHDNSISKLSDKFTDVFGEIRIENNVFVGANAIILPGVTIGVNSIIGAGSVVTKSIPTDTVVAGNPARIICTTTEYFSKIEKYGINFMDIDNVYNLYEYEEKFIHKGVNEK